MPAKLAHGKEPPTPGRSHGCISALPRYWCLPCQLPCWRERGAGCENLHMQHAHAWHVHVATAVRAFPLNLASLTGHEPHFQSISIQLETRHLPTTHHTHTHTHQYDDPQASHWQ